MINNLLTVIIPVHSVEGNFKKYFDLAIDSIKSGSVLPTEVLIVYPDGPDSNKIKKTVKEADFGELNVNLIAHTEGSNFQSQINAAAKNVKTEYFSFIEFDDEYSSIWFKNVSDYIEKNPDMDMFLPIISDVNEANEFLGYSNEISWALNFCNELGLIDHDTLTDYPNFNIDGMVVKTKSFIDCGGLKPGIKLSFNYEFLLRFTNLSNKILVIPKIGYKHTNMRKDSLFWNYRNKPEDQLTPEEAKFWMTTAQEEFYHKIDRGITYSN